MSLNCTVLKWLNACYVNFTSIKQTKRIGSTPPIQTHIALHTLFPGPSAATSHTYFLCLRKEYALPHSFPFCRHLPIPRTCLSFSLGLAGSPQCLSMVRSSAHCPPVPVQTSCIELINGFADILPKVVAQFCFMHMLTCDLRSSYIFTSFFFLCPLTQGWWRRTLFTTASPVLEQCLAHNRYLLSIH